MIRELVERAARPPLTVQRGGLMDFLSELPEDFLLLTQPEPLELLPAPVVARASHVHLVDSLDSASLKSLNSDLPVTPVVVGVGGGMVMDAAKYLAWRRGSPLYLAPSIVSVDASVTNTVAVREGGRVTYQGFVVADRIMVDPDFVRHAPARLNRAGIGDLVSIHTALWDWRRGAAVGRAMFDETVAASALEVFEQIEELGDEIASVSDRGIEGIVTGYARVNAMCLEIGHSQPEEGSEHYFAYNVEKLTGRSFVHGQLVGLGTVLMASLQRNDPQRLVRLLDRARVEWRPPQLGIDADALKTALVTLRSFIYSAGLPYSVINEVDLSHKQVDVLLGDLESVLALRAA